VSAALALEFLLVESVEDKKSTASIFGSEKPS
jgi:hypothetical protein